MHNSWPFFWGPSVLLSASLYLSLKGNVRLGTVPLWGFHILSWSSRRHAAQEDKWPSEAAGPWIPTAGQGQTPTGKETELGERRRRLSSLAQWIRTYKSQTRAAQPPLPRDPSFGTCSHRRERGCVGGLITSISGRESWYILGEDIYEVMTRF